MMEQSPEDVSVVTGQIVGVTFWIVCQCGDRTHHEVECIDDDGFWTAPMQDRFCLCESCERVIDAGVHLNAGAPT